MLNSFPRVTQGILTPIKQTMPGPFDLARQWANDPFPEFTSPRISTVLRGSLELKAGVYGHESDLQADLSSSFIYSYCRSILLNLLMKLSTWTCPGKI